MKYFGTSGARGIWGKNLNTELVRGIANSLALLSPKRVLIGTDTRKSGLEITKIMREILEKAGVFCIELGQIPSPAMAFLIKKLGVDYGVMVTASHNPPEHNGICIYDHEGEYLSGAALEKFDASISPIEMWQDHVYNKFAPVFSGKTLPRVAIDFANGSGANVALNVMQRLGFLVDAYNNKPNGNNSNKNCGATHPECFKPTKPFDVAFSFDGDGDRLIAFDADLNIISPDRLIALYAVNLGVKHVVSTVMLNTGVEKFLLGKKIGVTRTNVGERFLIPELKKYKSNETVGGEASSHFIFPDVLMRGDSLTSALKVIEILVKTGKTLAELTLSIPEWPSVLHNTEIDIADGEKKTDDYRIFIRKSGTEKLTRVFVEATNEQKRDELLAQILKDRHM